MKKVDMPELEKIQKVHEKSQLIGEFLEWLNEQEISLAEWSGSDCEVCGDEMLMPMNTTKECLLAKYFDIDLDKAEKERRALLDAIRADNEGRLNNE